MKRFAVIGLGKFGTAIARELSKRGADVLAIDVDETHVEALKEDVSTAVTLDTTDKKALIAQGVHEVDAAVVSIGENFEAALLAAVYLKEMDIPRIIARANGPQQRMILEKVGIKEILSPEDEVGTVMAERLINPSILAFLQLPDEFEIVEIKAPPKIIGMSLGDLRLRRTYQISIVTIKRMFDEESKGTTKKTCHVLGVPGLDTVIQPLDTLVIFGTVRNVQKFTQINS